MGIYRGKDGYLIQGFEKSEIDKEDQGKTEDFEFIFRTQFTTSKLCHACTDSIMDF